MDFPQSVSLTITNHCNLRCRMCGQWSEEGYINLNTDILKKEMTLADWKRVVDELADHHIASVLLRGGEVFLYPGIIELMEYIHGKGMFISVDTNGTMLKDYAADIVRIGNIHLTISVDGPEAVHDSVRGIPGCFQRIKAGLDVLNQLDPPSSAKINRAICFTISQYSVSGLGVMPDVARSLSIGAIVIVPYYYFPQKVGQAYQEELRELGCPAFSWQGFHHETSGVDFSEFQTQYRAYLENLKDVFNYPYLPLSEDQYKTWFSDALTPVGPTHCTNVEKLIDIQPSGEADFCVDFPDYSFGNVKEATIQELWNGEKAARFRDYRREKPLAVCYRCGAKKMSELP
jgi:MoaA/NifB/PqqE/SkfB family radical SAM enzyme